MKLAFLPAQLFLDSTASSEYVVTQEGRELLRTKSQKEAVAHFNKLRLQLEREHPTKSPPVDSALLRKEIGESLVDDNHYGPQRLKKGRRSTRTFG